MKRKECHFILILSKSKEDGSNFSIWYKEGTYRVVCLPLNECTRRFSFELISFRKKLYFYGSCRVLNMTFAHWFFFFNFPIYRNSLVSEHESWPPAGCMTPVPASSRRHGLYEDLCEYHSFVVKHVDSRTRLWGQNPAPALTGEMIWGWWLNELNHGKHLKWCRQSAVKLCVIIIGTKGPHYSSQRCFGQELLFLN